MQVTAVARFAADDVVKNVHYTDNGLIHLFSQNDWHQANIYSAITVFTIDYDAAKFFETVNKERVLEILSAAFSAMTNEDENSVEYEIWYEIVSNFQSEGFYQLFERPARITQA